MWLTSSSRHWCLHIEQPQAQHPPTSTHFYESTFPPEVWDPLVSDASWCHHREEQNHFLEHFHSLFLAGGMIFQPLCWMLIPWLFSSDSWKLISLSLSDFILKKENKIRNVYIFFNLTLSSLYLLNNVWKLVLRALPVTICLFKMNRLMYPNCKSLWIKVSAKWINVNINVK